MYNNIIMNFDYAVRIYDIATPLENGIELNDIINFLILL